MNIYYYRLTLSLFLLTFNNFSVSVSIFTIFIIAYLIIAETSYFLDSRLQFKFEPDTEIDAKLQINIDITVAMPCGRIGADVLDSTNQNMIDYDSLTEEDTWWELTSEQRAHFEALKHMNSYLREEYHAIHELLWKSNQVTLYNEMPKRYGDPSTCNSLQCFLLKLSGLITM
jgi:outer membrane protease